MSESESTSEIVMALAEEFLERYRRGEKPPLKEYIDRRPDLAAEIREVFPAMAMMENIALADASVQGQAASLERPPPELLQQLGDYRIIRKVASGGMGIVYEAEQVSLGRHVALKVLPQKMLLDPKYKRRFEREAKAGAKLHHTNIVPVFGVGEQDGMPYYVMQFIQGLGLDEVLDELRRMKADGQGEPKGLGGEEKRPSHKEVSAADVARSLMTGGFAPTADQEGQARLSPPPEQTLDEPRRRAPAPSSGVQATERLSGSLSGSSIVLPGQSEASRRSGAVKKQTYWQSVAHIGVQVADALEYAHKQGILHRDVKPSNLLLDLGGTVWVTDFGLAKADDQQNLTHTGDVLGTLRYMPPEAFDGRTDARSDVYSLGLTLYELLTLRPAFAEKDRHKLIKQVTTQEVPRLDRFRRDVPRDLVTIVHKAIDRESQRRYQTASALAADLQRFVDDEPIQARRTSPLERAGRWCRRNPLVASLTAALVFLAGFAAVTWKWREAEQQRDLARAQAETSRRLLYVTDISLAHQRSESGSVQWVRELLDRHQPQPGQEDLRGFEWYYLDHLTRPSAGLLTLEGHTDKCHGIAYSADGRRIATASEDQSVRVWDAQTGRQVLTFKEHRGSVWGVTFSPDSRWLATSGHGGVLKMWAVESGAEHFTIEGGRELNMSRAAYSPDGRWITAGVDRVLKVWSAETGRERIALRGHTGWITGVAFSPDGRRIASSSAEGMIRIWELETSNEVLTLKGHRGGIWGVAYSRCGRRIASGGLDQTVRIWDADTGRELSLTQHGHIVHSVAFSPDGGAPSIRRHGPGGSDLGRGNRPGNCRLQGH